MSYGVDIWCTDSMHTGRLARGITVVAQALYRRQITPRGTLRGGDEEANYGIDLAGYVGSSDPETAALALPGIIGAELRKDDRVADVQTVVTVEKVEGLDSFTIKERVVLHDEDSAFTLTLSVSQVGAALLGVTT